MRIFRNERAIWLTAAGALALSGAIYVFGPPWSRGADVQPAQTTDGGAAADSVQSSSTAARFGVRLLDAKASEETGSLVWLPLDAVAKAPSHLVLLVHGLDEPGSIWDDLTPALDDAGLSVARFEYPNDQPIATSASFFAGALRSMRSRGVRRIDLVAHSMGGLVCRDALTRDAIYNSQANEHDGLPGVDHFITVGTPNFGAPLAKLRFVAEVREQLSRWTHAERNGLDGLLGGIADGHGEAGRDLTPGSAFLNDLNARPLPRDLKMTIIAGELSPADRDQVHSLFSSQAAKLAFGGDGANRIDHELEELICAVGDGVVPLDSALLPGVSDVVHLNANHRGMLKTWTLAQQTRAALGAERDVAPAIPIILDRLRKP